MKFCFLKTFLTTPSDICEALYYTVGDVLRLLPALTDTWKTEIRPHNVPSPLTRRQKDLAGALQPVVTTGLAGPAGSTVKCPFV